MNKQLEVTDILKIIKNRKKIFLLSFIPINLIAFAIALLLPSVYITYTTIVRESQQVSEDYIRSTITGYAEQRIKAVTQEVKSRRNLLALIKEYDLYPELRDKKTIQEIVTTMRTAIRLQANYEQVTNERTGRSTSITNSFLLSYEGSDPHKVQQVANRLASFYIERELQAREENVSATTNFLVEELDNLKRQIRDQEERIRLFKEKNVGTLPENYNMNIRTLDNLQREKDRLEDRLRTLEERKLFLKGKIATVDPLAPIKTDKGKVSANPNERLKYLRLKLMSMQSSLSDKHPDIIALKNEIRELESQVKGSDETVLKIKRLKELESTLASLRGQLGPKHPDIIKLEKEINEISREVEKLGTRQNVERISEEHPDNPTYIRLTIELDAIEAEANNYKKDIKKLNEHITSFERKVVGSPLVEKKYNELTRDYESIKRKYNDISNMLMEARVAQGMEVTQRGERFKIIDKAPFPEKPYKPNRLAIITLGFLTGLIVSIGLLALQESMDQTIKSSDELSLILGVDVFTTISFITTESEKRRGRAKKIAIALGIVGFICICLLAISKLVMPLDLLWEELVNRMATIN